VVVLTGAGISAESGIPTFRGPEGYWTVGSAEYHPQELATLAAFRRMPREVWHWYLFRRSVYGTASPNPAHRAIVRLEQALGPRFTLVTQNVDGLHLRAGNSAERTCQIHGNIDYMRCSRACHDSLYALPPGIPAKGKQDVLTDDELELLRCPRCHALSRPHVLWFDESYEEELFRSSTALRAAARCEVLVVVGTSGGTTLPMYVLNEALRNDAFVVDVNPDDNPFAQAAEHNEGARLRGPASEHVPALVQGMLDRG
jgi:NAD-dependent deacetylase